MYKEFKQKFDNRPMKDICNFGSGAFELQAQQKFLKKFVVEKDWKSLLLYHQIGSGKTCTSITVAEEFRVKNPDYTIKVILPARLKTNFLDELLTPCAQNKYISELNIKSQISKKINENYDIMSFEKWKTNSAKLYPNLKIWCKDFTKNALIIVDEVHNLIPQSYESKKWKDLTENHKMPKSTKSNASLLFKYMVINAHPSCKFIFMTATPVFNSIIQLKELAEIMTPGFQVKVGDKISDIMTLSFKDKVSYFPGTSPNAYPQTKYTIHKIPLSQTQDNKTHDVQQSMSDEPEPELEAFLSKQRQLSISVYKTPANNIENPSEFCPKLEKLIQEIKKKKDGKHLVYTSFIKQGIDVIKLLLEEQGWTRAKQSAKPGDPYKTYAVWDGTTKDAEKEWIKTVVNSKENRYGKHIRVVIGSPSIKEGVSFKHIQDLHMIDPVWNTSAKTQVEGRAIRFCSHIDMPANKRTVRVHIYKCVPRTGGKVKETCDEIIYDMVIPKKEDKIRACEEALKNIALDKHLFGSMYIKNDKVYEDYTIMKQKEAKVKSSCPKKRRPLLGKCLDKYVNRLNTHGDECCYKEKKEVVKKEKKFVFK